MRSSRDRAWICLAWAAFLSAVPGCARYREVPVPTTVSRQATPAEIVELKAIYTSYLQRAESWERETAPPRSTAELLDAARQDDDIVLQRYAIRRLAFHDDEATREVLRRLVSTGGLVERYYAACSLAYQGSDGGLEILLSAVAGQEMFSASGYEISEAGMSLAVLGHRLPPSFVRRPNAFFTILDRLFE